MSWRKILGHSHTILIIVFVLYVGIRFPDGEVVPCAELQVCTDPSYEGPSDFDKANCAPGNFCASRSSRLRSAEDVEPSKDVQSIVWVMVLSGVARFIGRRIMDGKKVKK